MPLFLASASPRRLALLLESGLDPVPCPTGVPEEPLPGESAEAHVLRLASAKGRHALARLAASRATGLVLAADTAVVLGGAILGKPADDADAAAMLRRLSGRAHEVLTGVFLSCHAPSRPWSPARKCQISRRASVHISGWPK